MVQQYFLLPRVVSILFDDIESHLNLPIIPPYDDSIVVIYTYDQKSFNVHRNFMVDDEDTDDIFPFTRNFLESIRPCYIEYFCKYSNPNKNAAESYEMFRQGIPWSTNRNQKVLYGDESLIPKID